MGKSTTLGQGCQEVLERESWEKGLPERKGTVSGTRPTDLCHDGATKFGPRRECLRQAWDIHVSQPRPLRANLQHIPATNFHLVTHHREEASWTVGSAPRRIFRRKQMYTVIEDAAKGKESMLEMVGPAGVPGCTCLWV